MLFSNAQGLVRLKDYFCFALNELSLSLALLRLLLLLLLLLLLRLRLLLLELSRQRLSQVVEEVVPLVDITPITSKSIGLFCRPILAEHDELKSHESEES